VRCFNDVGILMRSDENISKTVVPLIDKALARASIRPFGNSKQKSHDIYQGIAFARDTPFFGPDTAGVQAQSGDPGDPGESRQVRLRHKIGFTTHQESHVITNHRSSDHSYLSHSLPTSMHLCFTYVCSSSFSPIHCTFSVGAPSLSMK
jgi:hypothetical protein